MGVNIQMMAVRPKCLEVKPFSSKYTEQERQQQALKPFKAGLRVGPQAL
jgi:hypothetical protein